MEVNIKEVERLMKGYKRTKDEKTFETILEKMKPLISSQAYAKSKISKTNMNDQEDLESIASNVVWEAIEDYRFICPICGIKAKNEQAFKKHIEKRHGCGTIHNGKKVKSVSAYPNMFTYVYNMISNNLFNVVREESKLKRCANSYTNRVETQTDSSVDGNEINQYDNIADTSKGVEDVTISNQNIKAMMDKIKSEGKKIHLFVLAKLATGYNKTEIAEILHQKGKFGTLNSAKSTVTKVTKDLQKYYLALTA